MRVLIFIAASTILACASFWVFAEDSLLGQALDLGMLLSAITGMVFALNQRLPAQNILAAAILIALIAGIAALVSPGSGVPFGKIAYASKLKLFGILPWPIPLLWVAVVLSAREAGRLCLQRWRRSRSYGFWLAGSAAALAVMFDLSLEPFAIKV